MNHLFNRLMNYFIIYLNDLMDQRQSLIRIHFPNYVAFNRKKPYECVKFAKHSKLLFFTFKIPFPIYFAIINSGTAPNHIQ